MAEENVPEDVKKKVKDDSGVSLEDIRKLIAHLELL